MQRAVSVSELGDYINKVLQSDFLLSNVTVRGELSKATISGYKHCFFSIKDKNDTALNCVIFNIKDQMQDLREGMEVLATGCIKAYPKQSRYQLVVTSIEMFQEGILFKQLEELKRKLLEEGLFDQGRKRSISLYPKAIGIITSPTGAAIHDLIHTIHRRMPMIDIILYPSLVQGMDAPESLIQGIQYFNQMDTISTLIIGRGGGSFEDLFAFQEERLVRAVAASKHPIISAVGHEADVVLTDHAADLRAPTPTAAGEMATRTLVELHHELEQQSQFIKQSMMKRVEQEERKLEQFHEKIEKHNPLRVCIAYEKVLDEWKIRTTFRLKEHAMHYAHALELQKSALDAKNPYTILKRGYAIVTKQENVISSIESTSPGDALEITFGDGTAHVIVEETRKNHENE